MVSRPRSRSPTSKSVTTVVFSVSPSTRASGCLVPVDADAQRQLLNHLKSQSFSSGNPEPLRSRQSQAVRDIYDRLRADGAQLVAVLGGFNKGPDKADPTTHPTLEPLFDSTSGLVDATGYRHSRSCW
jgi:hypothetical protein